MVSAYSPNINLEEPARGDQVGTWDTPVNANMTLIDLVVGGRTTVSLNNSPVVLSAAQFQCKTITFNSTLTGSVAITFPSTFTKSYEIYHTCTGSSAFVITLQTTVAGGQVVCCPPGEIMEVLNDGTNIRFKNFERVGGYWDYAGSSVPAWVSGCTVPPYLNCDGSTFSATTYPQLAVILGSTTLPDSKGRARYALDQSAARLSSAVAGFSPNTVGAGGGSQNYQQHTHTISITDPGHTHVHNAQTGTITAGSGVQGGSNNAPATINSAVTGITATASNSGTGTTGNIPPAYIGGLTLIRAA
jgi:hypothetical protein